MKAKRVAATFSLAAVLLLVNGCSGISSSQSVSPASFILPGLIHHDTTETNLLEAPQGPNLAAVRF